MTRLCLGLVLAASTGCGGIRIHDPGRLQVANEAVALATQVSTGNGDVFAPMEQNAHSVQSVQDKLRQLTDTHERETFVVILPRLTPADISLRLAKAMDKRNEVFAALRDSEDKATRAVNDELNRQAIISGILKDAAANSDTTATLERLKQRLAWLDGVSQAFGKLNEALAAAPKSDSAVVGAAIGASAATADGQKALDKAVAAAKTSLKSIDSAPTVTGSIQLIQRTAEQVISTEQNRLLVMRDYLAGLQRFKDTLLIRDSIAVCNLFLTAAGQVYPSPLDDQRRKAFDARTACDAQAATDPRKKCDAEAALVRKVTDATQKLEVVFQDLKDSGRYDCLTDLALSDASPAVGALWSQGRLADYVAADIAAHKSQAKSPELVGALGILLFHERRLFDDVRLNLAHERQLYSIRLSRVNAQERASMVHQLSEGLEIYYQGGVKPETVAQLILAAAQVGALTFIGAQQ
jgi:hypothetical protein